MTRGPNRIGRVYKKAIFRQFTDDSYSQEVAKPSWLGLLGPELKAEVEDTFIIHFKNFASRPYSVHPHGVFYKKDSEGALYPDGTSGKSKEDDFVLPGTNYTYTWPIMDNFAPTPADSPCLTWIYHSHIKSPKDISSGLIGPLLVCKKDSTSTSLADKYKGFALMFSNIDENISWYLDENINTFCLDPSTVNKQDEDFQFSNMMLSINGYMYGNIPGLEMCAGDLVSWSLIGMGNELDVHSVHFLDHVLINRGCRTDVISLFSATFLTAGMVAQNVGTWLVNCAVNRHMPGKQFNKQQYECNCGHKRKYFIAAERILWDYGPGGIDTFTGQPLNATDSDSAPYFRQGDDRIGGRYWKVQYVAYTDGSFSRRKKRPASEAHLGILGPVIKAEVGDTILVTFLNRGDKNHSMMPHGVAFDKSSEGFPYYNPSLPGAFVKPYETFKYEWRVPESVGPTPNDPACLTYLYYSATDPMMDTQSGLVGPLIICKKDTLKSSGKQKGVDKEFYLLFTIFDENRSFYFDLNIEAFTGGPSMVDKKDMDFQESNRMHGTFQVACRTFEHFTGGMKQWYNVKSCGKSSSDDHRHHGTVRTYYVAAEEVEWDYAPNKTWAEKKMEGMSQKERNFSNASAEDTIGSKYKKVVYREYIDGRFMEHKKRTFKEEHLQILGPFIHAEVGDLVVIIFKNKASRPYSISAHGVQEDAGTKAHVTMPGETSTYLWRIPEQSGPGVSDPNCISWAYYSTVHFVKDLYSGLIGPLITCRKGILNENGSRSDIDREFTLLFMTFDENESWYLNDNIVKYLHKNPEEFNPTSNFTKGNRKNGMLLTINGKIFNNLPGLIMNEGEGTNWYLIGMGNELDIHNVHFHGETFIVKPTNLKFGMYVPLGF
uniref:ferroxidase n=1 Tax=Pseudonaja textilis TaxID=8673 RepID=A0A670Y626_PSETE